MAAFLAKFARLCGSALTTSAVTPEPDPAPDEAQGLEEESWSRPEEEIMYFEKQLTTAQCPESHGLWCGVHGLNNILGKQKFTGQAMALIGNPSENGATEKYNFSRGVLTEAIKMTPCLSSFAPGWTPKQE